MPERIATIKEVQNLFDSISISTACRKRQLCRDALGKKKYQLLTISEFKKYFDLF